MAEITRKSRPEIYSDIVDYLRQTNKANINQIASALDIRWETVKNALETLEKTKFLIYENNEYSINSELNLNPNTILDLPLTEEQNKQFCQIANRIKELSKDIKQTILQKAVVEVIKKAKLNLPYGWYLYGECTIHKLEDTENYGTTTKYDKEIKETLNEFSKFDNIEELLIYLYQKNNNDLYANKLLLANKLKKPFTLESIKEINLLFMQTLISIHKRKMERAYYFECLNSSFAMLRKMPLEQLEGLRSEIIEAFNTIWQLIGTESLKNTIDQDYADKNKQNFMRREACLTETSKINLTLLKDNWPEIKLSPEIEKLRKKFKGSPVS